MNLWDLPMFNKLQAKLFMAILGIAIFYACSKKTATTTSSQPDFKTNLKMVVDSMYTNWSSMDASEKDKLQSIDRLLDELSYINGSNTVKIDSLKSSVKIIKTAMLRAESMTSQEIDDYDVLTDKLIRSTLALIASTPSTEEHPLIAKLESSITTADGNLIVLRYKYDRWAIQFNEIVTNNKGRLTKMGTPYSEYKIRPLFQIQP
ncbi:hypothetical protein MYP_3487 [Sporocytophaga myxococcoides]|uniref:Uncharacterized protein n=2 Tax=Sporocytophaga myxococcoides TaxID=153721 RepID=A0A098LJN0_9BACT|nr:hypothetical protein MYP_3487 [Sporocytophaga myxococcoides]